MAIVPTILQSALATMKLSLSSSMSWVGRPQSANKVRIAGISAAVAILNEMSSICDFSCVEGFLNMHSKGVAEFGLPERFVGRFIFYIR